ncbi:hypothetical protein [Enhygromyxa salina]|nr:hypothetical protein [Enhygromyxa salina]
MGWTTSTDVNGNIHVRFGGYLDAKGGVNSANEVLRLLEGQARDLVLNVANMTGYHRGARLAWQGLLWDHRGLIRRIVMIGADAAIHMTGRVIARHLGVPLSVIPAERIVELDAPVRRTREHSNSGSGVWDITRPVSTPLPTPAAKQPGSGEQSGQQP